MSDVRQLVCVKFDLTVVNWADARGLGWGLGCGVRQG